MAVKAADANGEVVAADGVPVLAQPDSSDPVAMAPNGSMGALARN